MSEPIKIKVNVTKPPKDVVITVPAGLPVFTDKKTNVKTVSFPFAFADGVNGFLTITRLVQMGWLPDNDIASITIKFK